MNEKKFHSKGLNYYCHQTEKDFEHTSNGLFCHLCNKNIIDFREKTKAEYERIVRENPKGCGIFYADQIGDEIEISLNWKKPLVAASFIISFLFSQKTVAQSMSKAQVELSDSSQSTKTDTIKCSEKKKINKANISSQTSASKNKKISQKKMYLSRRFPFIHFNRRQYAGDYW